MRRNLLLSMVVCLSAVSAVRADWLAFRGTDGGGVSADKNIPEAWSDDENIAWKAVLPGRGASSPIVIGNRVVLTANSGVDQDRLHVLCFDAATGRKMWERQFWATGRTMCHPKTSMATQTPVSDGERIYALFATCDLVCLDLDGNLLWLRGLAHDYPGIGNNVGLASSPVVRHKTVIALIENDGDSFAIGIDTATGRNRWRRPRARRVNWTSPVVLPGQSPSDDLVLFQSGTGLSAHDPTTGALRWSFESKCDAIPSAVVHDGAVALPGGGVTLLRPAPDGEKPKPAWNSKRLRPATAGPLIYEGKIYTVASAGVVSCADLTTGESLWQLRLTGPFSASPVAAGGRLYFINEKGLAQTVDPGPPAKIVATSDFGETILASPAIADGAMYVRSDGHLWRIARTR